MHRNKAPQVQNSHVVWACCLATNLILLSGCVTTSTIPELAWVRTDGRKIGDDPALLQQGKSDIVACDANLDSGPPTASARGCMAQKGYVLVQKDQAEDVRAAYAAAARRAAPNR
jgi:hypothetical protein